MKSDSIHLVVHLKARQNKIDELYSLLTEMVSRTREEPGCTEYKLLRNRVEYSEFTIVEEWESQAALDLHFGKSYLLHALEKFPALLEIDADLRTYELVK